MKKSQTQSRPQTKYKQTNTNSETNKTDRMSVGCLALYSGQPEPRSMGSDANLWAVWACYSGALGILGVGIGVMARTIGARRTWVSFCTWNLLLRSPWLKRKLGTGFTVCGCKSRPVAVAAGLLQMELQLCLRTQDWCWHLQSPRAGGVMCLS